MQNLMFRLGLFEEILYTKTDCRVEDKSRTKFSSTLPHLGAQMEVRVLVYNISQLSSCPCAIWVAISPLSLYYKKDQ